MRTVRVGHRIISIVFAALLTVASVSAQPLATPAEQESRIYVAHAAGFLADMPDHWSADLTGAFHYIGRDGGVISGPYVTGATYEESIRNPASLEAGCADLAAADQPSPVIESWNGTRACTLRDTSRTRWALDTLLFEHPSPAQDGSNKLAFITADHDHFDAIVNSMTFDASRLTAGDYLTSAIDGMEAVSIWRDLVDWPAIRKESLARLGEDAASTDTSLTWPIIGNIMGRLGTASGDPHHFFLHPVSVLAGTPMAVTLPSGSIGDNGIGTIVLPEFMGTEDQTEDYVSAARDVVADGHSAGACGWIVDLRVAHGGAIYPMISAIAPLLPQGTGMNFRDVHGEFTEVRYEGNGVILVDSVTYPLDAPVDAVEADLLGAQPVAVLIGPGTASAGEATAVVLASRNNTIFIGDTTAGMATAPSGLRLFDDAVILIAGAEYVGPRGATYDDGIAPDIQVTDTPGETDDVVETATTWLLEQPGCAPLQSGTRHLHA